MSTKNKTIDVDQAVDRMHDLDDQQLAELSANLDADLREAREGIPTDDVLHLTAIAAAARILLRQRRAHAACARAISRICESTRGTE